MTHLLMVKIILLVALAGSSLQQATRAPLVPQWSTKGYPGFPGYQGTGQGFRQGYRGVQGYPSDGRYGFEIVDAPDRYGYVSNYPGGRTSFFLLGPNRGPGQQSYRGSTMADRGGPQMSSYRPTNLGSGGWRQPGSW
ncbi:uncharacterized protein LOC128988025 isoform X2 [Macrosteles quadrilineatus]|uniref:uncharacterized protein LOC128988025 isoform X2 n=1 Tax=Macrosteles quadrilineatus TaxID=74068 RepID=UPI0023E0F696|nr:uncharacterized protein LOC128988025 isoform X2 [Macrosteles quadrilineatus]